MRIHHITYLACVAAFLAMIASVFLAYTPHALVEVVVAAPAESEHLATSSLVGIGIGVAEPVVTKLGLPIADAFNRVTKKTFGMEVHPETSPVLNDRFNGYHVGVDFETFDEEKDSEVPILAVCNGPLLTKQFANGYGGYALQACQLDGESVRVLYGHLNIKSIQSESGDELTRGQTIGVLGKGYSHETDGVRKHLHLGIHRGTGTDIRGYVQRVSEVDQWLDVLPYLNH